MSTMSNIRRPRMNTKRMVMMIIWIMLTMGMVGILVRRRGIDSKQEEMAVMQPVAKPVAKKWLY